MHIGNILILLAMQATLLMYQINTMCMYKFFYYKCLCLEYENVHIF